MIIEARNKPRALVIDDEPDIRDLLAITLGRMQIEVVTAGDQASALKALGPERFDLVLTDMRLPDGNGLDIVEWIQQHRPGVPVAVITAHGNVEAAVRALKLGAFDFISKPLDLASLRKLITATLKLRSTDGAEFDVTQPVRLPTGLRLLGQSRPMQQLQQMIAKVARSQAPVHICGDSGTGKELAARLIHDSGPRRDGPFVPVNCGAIPSELMESELFGHKKGSFTGAVADKEGLIRSAEGGTLFLDEVADLPLHMQVKLLRVIQEKSIRPVGETRESPVDIRVLSATHRKLDELVRAGKFREDLYYRINVIELRVPALRERLDDVPPLVDMMLDRMADADGHPAAADHRRGDGQAAVLFVSRQRARTREHPRARADAVLGRSHRARGHPAEAGAVAGRPAGAGGQGRYGRRAGAPMGSRASWNTSSARPSSGRWSRPATTRPRRRSCWG